VGVQNFPANFLWVTLPEQPQEGDELKEIYELLSEEVNSDVVADLSQVEILTPQTLCALMTLDRLLREFGHLLVLCNVPSKIERTFAQMGISRLFEFAKDDFAALQYIRSECHLPV
jgi:anti-anti-sigma regulatory factor